MQQGVAAPGSPMRQALGPILEHAGPARKLRKNAVVARFDAQSPSRIKRQRSSFPLSSSHDDRDNRTRAEGTKAKPVVRLIVAAVVAVIFLILLRLATGFLVDWLWFSSIGYLPVF